MCVVLGFDQGDGDVGLIVKNVIGALPLAPADQLAAHDNASFGEADLLANLRHRIPASISNGWCDELCTDVAFAEVFLVHIFWVTPSFPRKGTRCQYANYLREIMPDVGQLHPFFLQRN